MRRSDASKRFENALNRLAFSLGLWEVFQDFLDFSLLMLRWWDVRPESFAALEKKYPDAEQHKLFVEAFFSMADMADNEGIGFSDPFGDWFMEHLSSDRKGQFFTPEEVCTIQAKIALGNSIPDGSKICDPTCGSGRLLLAAARINRKAKFYASDIDLTCCKMTVINFMLNSMPGEVAWMDTIRLDHWGSWHIKLVMDGNAMYRPYYIQTGPGETQFIQRLKNSLPPEPVTGKDEIKTDKKGQILLFE